jgi:PAS domain S-box-containing protein
MQVGASKISVRDEVSELRNEVEALRAQLKDQKQAAEDYKFFLELHSEICWTAAPDGRILVFDQRWYALTGRVGEQVPDEAWIQVQHPEDQPHVADAWRRSVVSGEPFDVEHRICVADGSVRWMRSRAVPHRNATGEIVRWYGTTKDIHEPKQTSAGIEPGSAVSTSSEQQRSLEREPFPTDAILQMVIDNVPGLVSYIDLDTRYRFANRQYQDWFNIWPLVGRKVPDVVGEPAFRLARPYFNRAMAGERVQFEEFLPYTTARPRHVDITYAPDIAEDGTVRGIVTMVQDITDRKHMEEQLRHSKERLQQVFAQAPVAVAVLRGPEFVFELANTSYQEFFPGRELLGRPLLDAVPEISAAILTVLERVLASGEPVVVHEFLVPIDSHRNGLVEDCWFTFVYQPLREIDGTVAGVVVVAVDVTQQVRARRELERVNRELEEFAYVASHDLQEPLRMVNIYSQLLLKNFVNNHPDAAEYAGFVRQGVSRMETLIRDLLTYSRIVQRDEMPVGSADLSAALEEAQAVLKERIKETNATITAEALPSVYGETKQLSHVFQNLLSNSLKYRKKSVAPDIHITAVPSGEQWTIAVRDNGIGFEPQYSERIFGLFKRLHKDEYPGTGLGLAICQRIVERYGGRMWAQGRPGEGATLFFMLPVTKKN